MRSELSGLSVAVDEPRVSKRRGELGGGDNVSHTLSFVLICHAGQLLCNYTPLKQLGLY